ncbi:RNA-directed DNA polymerase, eukaryota, reverse transcriptase zinc-binding domain protein [Tanacetum coccineum]
MDTSSTNANIRALVLDDQDLINVEDPSMVLLVKLKDVNSMSNMYVISRNEDNFNSFIDNSGLIDLPLGDRLFTWMNKAGTKLSKLDRLLILEEVDEALLDVRVTAIDHLWSDHNHILLHVSKSDSGPTPFKLFHSWLLRDSFHEVIKTELPKLEEHNFGRKLLSHGKFRLLKARIKQWHSETKTSDRVTKHDNLELIKFIEEKIKAGFANDDDRDSRIKLLQQVDKLDTFESFDLFQKAHVKWDIEGDENSKFFHGLIKQKRRAQMIHGVHYKIIANRLAKVIDKSVSHEQSAFIVGFQILDGPFILSEIAEWLKKKKKKLLIFMVDFEKAFDSVFYLASGLKINIQKSNVYGIRVSDVDASSMASFPECASGSFLFTYLGLPIGSNMSLTSSWQVLLDMFQSKGGSHEARKLAWIKWKNVLSSYNNGGLNIGSHKAFNLALLQKWRWRLLSLKNALWVKVIEALHGQRGGFDNNGCIYNGSSASIRCFAVKVLMGRLHCFSVWQSEMCFVLFFWVSCFFAASGAFVCWGLLQFCCKFAASLIAVILLKMNVLLLKFGRAFIALL